jgi:hypothetical protein
MGEDHITAIKGQLQPLLAAVDGQITWTSTSSGNYLQLTGDDGWRYCYLHINNDTPGTDDGLNPPEWIFAEGIKKGSTVARGQHIAYMGDSGNAEAAGTHLHFEIRQPGTSPCSGGAINAAESLRRAEVVASSAPDSRWAPFASGAALVAQQYTDFLGREADKAGTDYWVGRITSGKITVAEALKAFMDSPEFGASAAPVTRLYAAYFLRIPDYDGLSHWIGERAQGRSLGAISEAFSGSPEFSGRYGALTDTEFVDLIYRNVLGRDADAAGRSFWIDRLRKGMTRGGVMVQFSESPEYTSEQQAEVYVTMSYIAMLRRVPDDAGFEYWVDQVDEGVSITKLLGLFLDSDEYAARVG